MKRSEKGAYGLGLLCNGNKVGNTRDKYCALLLLVLLLLSQRCIH